MRLLSALPRVALAGVLFLMALGALRWAPVHAEPPFPFDLRVLSLAPCAVLLAIAAALSGGERRPRRWRPCLVALGMAALGLGALVLLRPPSGLSIEAIDQNGGRHSLAPGLVDIIGPDLAGLPESRRWTIEWNGILRVPDSGPYRLWAHGNGRVEATLDGEPVLRAEGASFRVGAARVMGKGDYHLRVRLEHRGPGLRLRLGWDRPRAGGPGGARDLISPRYLGPRAAPVWWRVTDALALVVAALVASLSILVPWERRRSLPLPSPVSAREIAVSLAGYGLLAVLMSWPLATDLGGIGVVDRSDGRLNAWILAWDVHALLHEPGRLFQAPIFHPLTDTLAFSENLVLPALLAAPAILLGNPVLGYNVMLLLSCIVSGLGVQLLVRRVSGDRLAAFVAGAAFAVGPHRWLRLAHLHAEVTLFLPLVFVALDRFWEKRTLRRGLVVGLLLALQALSSVYLGAITAVALAAVLVVAVFGRWRAREMVPIAAGVLFALLLTAPVAWPYLRMREFQGAEFSLAAQSGLSATPASYAAGSSRLYVLLSRRHLDAAIVRDPLFPGLVLLGLGIAGLASAPRRYRMASLAAMAAAVWISLGPQTALYRFVHDQLLLLHGIRALGRFSLIVMFSLAVLSGLALSGRGAAAALIALALLLAESANIPLRYGRYEPPSPAARWLAGQAGAVAYLPLGPETDTRAMLQGIAHFRPLLNGESGLLPRPYAREMALLAGDALSEDALRFLRAVGVSHIVTRDDRSLPLLARFGDERVYAVPAGETARDVRRGRAYPTLWGRNGCTLDLGEPLSVAGLVFEVSDEPWLALPRVAFSTDGARWEETTGQASLADAALSLTRDPRHGPGEIRVARTTARYVRLDPALPVRPGVLWVTP